MTDDARAKAVEAAADWYQYEMSASREDAAYFAHGAIAAYERTMAEAGWVMAERKLLAEAHACMRATGWQLALGPSHHGSDGVLEAACVDVEDRFAAMLAGRAGEEG